jgi:hypothetical protein
MKPINSCYDSFERSMFASGVLMAIANELRTIGVAREVICATQQLPMAQRVNGLTRVLGRGE